MNRVLHWVDHHPRRLGLVVSVGCVALLAFGLYLQHVVGLEPCPMCIVQRYALVLVALVAAWLATQPTLTTKPSRRG